jgi:hypothetical protein
MLMTRFRGGLYFLLLFATPASAGIVSGVGSITTGLNNTTPGTGRTVLENTGATLGGLYGTENLGYLIDDFPGALGYDGLVINATAEINDSGTVSGADNSAILGYGNPVTGHRSETNFGVSLYHPGDGRIFLLAGGSLIGPVGNWADTFGRNNPFNIALSASLSGNSLTISGTITEADAPANQIIINQVATVNPGTTSGAFGTSSGFEQIGVQRNYGVVFSNVSYSSTLTVPEPATGALFIAMGIAAYCFKRGRHT